MKAHSFIRRSALETQELMGIVVEIQETKGYWMKVKSPSPTPPGVRIWGSL
ncbi:MAG: hypothetical protein MJY67_03130 [Bacteroidales bacterium]|nr:hypothetical protein [Bacteroidales bacterium]